MEPYSLTSKLVQSAVIHLTLGQVLALHHPTHTTTADKLEPSSTEWLISLWLKSPQQELSLCFKFSPSQLALISTLVLQWQIRSLKRIQLPSFKLGSSFSSNHNWTQKISYNRMFIVPTIEFFLVLFCSYSVLSVTVICHHYPIQLLTITFPLGGTIPLICPPLSILPGGFWN